MRFEKSTNLLDIPSFKKGSKIHIKKKNRGKFTEYCGGEVTQKCIDKAKRVEIRLLLSVQPLLRSEHAVFNHATDPTKVVKVYAVNENGFPNIEAVREFHKHFMKRNQIPFTVKNKFSGYLQGENGIFPYYMQDKVKPLPPMKDTQYEKELLPRLIKQLKTKGYKPIGSDAYSNGKFTITDLTEENMAIDSKGNFIFFDPRVYCLGGKLHK